MLAEHEAECCSDAYHSSREKKALCICWHTHKWEWVSVCVCWKMQSSWNL